MKTNRIGISIALIIMFVLAACGSQTSNAAEEPQPDTLNIVAHPVTNTRPAPTTVTNTKQVQQLYHTIITMPAVVKDRICTMQAGIRYDLTFLADQQTILTTNADSSGCGTVILSTTDQRQPDKSFWDQLEKMTGSATGKPTPTTSPDRLQIVVHPIEPDPVRAINVDQLETVHKLYQVIYALPPLPEHSACPKIAGPAYELFFFAGQRQFSPIKANRGGCGTVTIEDHDTRLASTEFWQLLEQAGA